MADKAAERLSRRDEQREWGLQKANAVRLRRKAIKEAIREGTMDPIRLVRGDYEEHEADIARWKIESLLAVVPGIGPATAQEIYEVGQFSPIQRVRTLSMERRDQLARLCAQGMGRLPRAHKSRPKRRYR